MVMKYGPGGIKAAMDMLGFYGGSPLRPLTAPSSDGAKAIKEALKEVQRAL